MLGVARRGYERLLAVLEQYEILSTQDRKMYAEYNEAPGSFSTISTTDPTARRNAKLANFKAEKELKAKIAVR